MRLTATLITTLVVLMVPSANLAQERAGQDESKSAKDKPALDRTDAEEKEKDAKEKGTSPVVGKPVVTKHEVVIGGRPFKYTVTAGLMPIGDAEGKTEAHIFFMSYTADDVGDRAQRPLMFSFNGGPGSSSVWLHLGALGPKRVRMPSDAQFPTPPFQLINNEHSWLDQTDLVFIDPVGTGYSRPVKPELGKKFFGLKGDIDSVSEFIRMYLTRYERWASPLFLVGESYGTTRAAGLAGHLVERGVAFNGIVLVSSALSFQTLMFDKGNELPYVLYLPSYAATAWYHKKLPGELQKDLRATLTEVESWAATDYARALGKGDRLQGDERRGVVEKLARYTGLETKFIDESNLRVALWPFCRELLRSEKRVVGRLDSRFKGTYGLSTAEPPGYDPSMAAIMAPYTSTFNQYVRTELDFKTDVIYHILGTGVGTWDWGTTGQGYANVTDAMRSALNQNPHMRLFIASGYFDLATPYVATEYTLDHMGLDPSVRRNIRMEQYEAGHMMYIHDESLAKLKREVASFIREAIGP